MSFPLRRWLPAFFTGFIAAVALNPSAFAQQSENGAVPTAPAASPTKASAAAMPGLVIFNPKNNHYYQSFGGDYTWAEANKKASDHTYNGVKGHLATVTSQDEYDFLVNSLFVYDYWIGGYRDATQLTTPPNFGWRWITNEPWGYTNWNDNEEPYKEPTQYVLSFWTGSMKWSKHVLSDKAHGYVVEYPMTKAPDFGATPALTPPQQIDEFTTNLAKNYRKLKTYQATVELNFKAFTDTVINVRATLMMQSDGKFRLEGRGENGKLIAISDGKRLMLALTEPGERMKFLVKGAPPMSQGIKEAFGLLTGAPKPPSLVELITDSFDRKVYSTKGVVGEYMEGDTLEQILRAKATVRLPGEDPVDGDLLLATDLNQKVYTRSTVDFRYKAYPFTAREIHSSIRINEAIPDRNFVFVITTNAEQVDDLGEGDDGEVTYSAPAVKK